MYLESVGDYISDEECPWCGSFELEVELSGSSDTTLSLSLTCGSCSECIDYEYVCDVDIEGYANSEGLLFEDISDAQCLVPIYEAGVELPQELIEIELIDTTYGVRYNVLAYPNEMQSDDDEEPMLGSIEDASINDIDDSTMSNVIKAIVDAEDVTFLYKYLDYIKYSKITIDFIEHFRPYFEKELALQKKTDLLDKFLSDIADYIEKN